MIVEAPLQTLDTKKLKRDCMMAIVIPLVLIAALQLFLEPPLFYKLLMFGVVFAGILFYALYRFFNRLDDFTWKQQLSSIIQNVRAPVLITDLNHDITYASKPFHALPLGKLLSRFSSLPEIFAFQHPGNSHLRQQKITYYRDMLFKLENQKLFQYSWEGKQYDLLLVSLFSPTGKRWGTLIECVSYHKPEEKHFSEHVAKDIDPLQFSVTSNHLNKKQIENLLGILK